MIQGMDSDRLVKQFLEFVKIDSPSFAEARFVEFLTVELKKLGLQVKNDRTGQHGSGNLLAVLPGTDCQVKPILLCMHTDTVTPGCGIRPRIENGVIRSDGTTILGVDNKAPIAAALEALRFLQVTSPVHGDVELLFTWGEERCHQGARAFDGSGLRSQIGFVPDGGGPLGTLITQTPYYTSIRATFLGKAAHAGIEPEKGVNALKAAATAISKMHLGRIDEETTTNLGTIAGGMVRNSVPDRVEVEGEARSLDVHKMEEQVRRMRAAMEEGAREVSAKLKVEFVREYEGFRIVDSDLPVRIATEAAHSMGMIPEITRTCGGSDANNLNTRGIRTIVLGIGAHDFHSPQEHIAVADLVRLAEFLATLVIEAGRQNRMA